MEAMLQPEAWQLCRGGLRGNLFLEVWLGWFLGEGDGGGNECSHFQSFSPSSWFIPCWETSLKQEGSDN